MQTGGIGHAVTMTDVCLEITYHHQEEKDAESKPYRQWVIDN